MSLSALENSTSENINSLLIQHNDGSDSDDKEQPLIADMDMYTLA